MKIIVGLGNPGEKYSKTRHNIGFSVVDQFAKKLGVCSNGFDLSKKTFSRICKTSNYVLLKPQTFMNDSGRAVRGLLDYYDFNNFFIKDDLYVIHDDLDIELGKFKFHFAKGPKIHNGLLSIYDHLKTTGFWHIRVGVDGRGGERREKGSDYVLKEFLENEKEIIDNTVKKIVKELSQKLLD